MLKRGQNFQSCSERGSDSPNSEACLSADEENISRYSYAAEDCIPADFDSPMTAVRKLRLGRREQSGK